MTESWSVRINVPGKPIGKGRARATVRGGFAKLYTPEQTANYESLVAIAGQQAMATRDPFDEPLSVSVIAFAPIAASWPKRKQQQAALGEIRPTGKPDLDNLIKALFDGMNKIVWRDDSVIVECVAEKWYGTKPGVGMLVRAPSTTPLFG